jgi:invasion protein IalB
MLRTLCFTFLASVSICQLLTPLAQPAAAQSAKEGPWVAPPNSPKEGPWFDFCATLAKEDAEWLRAELIKRGYRSRELK